MSRPPSATPIAVPNFDQQRLDVADLSSGPCRCQLLRQAFSYLDELIVGAARKRSRRRRLVGGQHAGLASALWLPLMRGTLTKPAEQPISAPPGKESFGTDW